MFLLFRNKAGQTHAVRYFDLPETAEKLGMMGPGEIYADTPLGVLVESAERLSQPA